MLSFLRTNHPVRTNNASNNPIIYENGTSSMTFRAPGSNYIMTHKLPPKTHAKDISIIEPPPHYHVYQDEFFHVQSGSGNFYRGFDKKPFAKLTGESGGQSTASVKAGQFHWFENASSTEELVVDIHLTPESYENEQRFFRNFFGYLDDCKTAKRSPSLFQLLTFLHSADTPVAIPIPNDFLARWASWTFTALGAFVGGWILGYQTNYPEYYEEGKSK